MFRGFDRWLPIFLTFVSLTLTHAEDEILSVEDVLVADGACDPAHVGPCTVCQPVDHGCLRPGWDIRGEYLLLRLRRRGSDFAIATDGAALAVGAGSVQNVESSYEPGYSISLGYVTTTGWALGFRFTGYGSDTTASAEAPRNGNLWATRSHPSRNQEAVTADAMTEFDYHLFDLEASRWFELNGLTSFRCFAGLSWIDTDQELLINYDGNDFNDGVVLNRQNDTGFGIRVGGESHWDVHRRCSVFARVDGRVMFTNTDLELLETNNAGADVIVDLRDSFTTPIANLGAAVGMAYYIHSWELRAGYELTNWCNLGNRLGFDDAHVGAYDPVSNDISLDGFFLSANCSY